MGTLTGLILWGWIFYESEGFVTRTGVEEKGWEDCR